MEGVKSKAQLLEHTQTLFIEYGEKYEVGYHDLMLYGGDYFHLAAGRALNIDLTSVCEAECVWLLKAATQLLPFAKLVGLATGAFLGGQFGVWNTVSTAKPPSGRLRDLMDQAATAVTRLATHDDTRLAYFCQRVEWGPLRFMPSGPIKAEPKPGWLGAPGLRHRAHIDMHPGGLSLSFGGEARWYCALPTMEDPDHIYGVGRLLGLAAAAGVAGREQQIQRRVRRDFGLEECRRKAGVEVDVYLPPKVLAGGVREAMDGVMGMYPARKVACKDDWRLKRIEDAPECEVCGWEVGDIPVSRGVIGLM